MIGAMRFACVFVAFAAGGCSGIRPYAGTDEMNLSVRTRTSGSFFSGVEARLHLYRVKDRCPTDYLGSVELDDDSTRLGLMPDQPVYLGFVFVTYERFGHSSGTVNHPVILTPRSGLRYIADVSYADRVYNVSMRELGPGGIMQRQIDRSTERCEPVWPD